MNVNIFRYVIRNSLLKNLAVGGLWIAEVDQFVQQLVDYDEVVADALFFHILEVILEDLAKKSILGKILNNFLFRLPNRSCAAGKTSLPHLSSSWW